MLWYGNWSLYNSVLENEQIYQLTGAIYS